MVTREALTRQKKDITSIGKQGDGRELQNQLSNIRVERGTHGDDRPNNLKSEAVYTSAVRPMSAGRRSTSKNKPLIRG